MPSTTTKQSTVCGLKLLAVVLLSGLGVKAAVAEKPAIDFTEFDAVVAPILAEMTLAEKVGQMTQSDLAGVKDKADIASLALGSILSGGNSDPGGGNSLTAWSTTYQVCQAEALQSRLGIPLLYGVDAVHGHNNVLGAVIYPHNIGLGCANDPALVEEIGRLTALEVRATGIPWTFAPCVTVVRDDRWGRTYEGFAEDPERVGLLGAALVRGLQGSDLASPTAVLACAKHFVGDGGTTAVVGSSPFKEGETLTLDQGDTRCDEATLRRLHVAPYLPSLAEGVGSIMPSYSSWNGVKCTASRELLTELLKEELGFEGFLISDYDAIDQCHEDYKTAIGIAINAGIDMAMVSTRYKEYIRCLTELVEEGTVPVERVDDAVRRILRVKAAMGLLTREGGADSLQVSESGFGSDQRRAVARRAVQQSLVLLKNQGTLPIKTGTRRIHVAGAKADDLGTQCGGWTIDWQGKTGDVTTGGTTLLEGIRQAAGRAEVSFSKDGHDAAGADLTIVVVGEPPYAEGFGDDEHLELSEEDQAVIAKVRANGSPIALVVLSGRPLVLSDSIQQACDAIVAAWLPGTEGAGVADVLFGKVAPTGTLAFTWPKDVGQHPINVGDRDYEPAFPYGHGLTFPTEAVTQRPTPSNAGG